MDDDYSFRSDLIRAFTRVLNAHPELDIVAGQAGLHFAGQMTVHNESLYLLAYNNHSQYLDDVDCYLVEFAPNFFMARTDAIHRIKWDAQVQ